MKREHDAGDSTYSSVRGRFRAWRNAHPSAESPSMLDFSEGLPVPELSPEAGRVVFTGIGLAIGLLLLVLLVVAIAASASWARISRDGAAVGYGVVAFFLLIASVGGIIAVVNHNFRVTRRKPEHH